MTDLVRRFTAWMGLWSRPPRRTASQKTSCNPRRLHCRSRRPPLPVHRRPYGLDIPLEGAATVSVRPYLVLHELRQPWRAYAGEVA
ncbi:hypothetical protein ABT382_05630 [Streptomyces pharetrae]|uniref:hypothetical protein n=1 Tax=Streptomyces pharetrae TaxID=291370 RepID=UPI003355F335